MATKRRCIIVYILPSFSFHIQMALKLVYFVHIDFIKGLYAPKL